MLRVRGTIRESVIPDIQVKILALCLDDNENGILLSSTQRVSKSMDFRADWALRDIITTKIQNQQKAIPLTLRKKMLYDNTLKETKSLSIIEKLSDYEILPINMRKLLLYKDCRAG